MVDDSKTCNAVPDIKLRQWQPVMVEGEPTSEEIVERPRNSMQDLIYNQSVQSRARTLRSLDESFDEVMQSMTPSFSVNDSSFLFLDCYPRRKPSVVTLPRRVAPSLD